MHNRVVRTCVVVRPSVRRKFMFHQDFCVGIVEGQYM